MFVVVVVTVGLLSAVHGAKISASDPLVNWTGRHVDNPDGTVSFDWLSVTARVHVTGASYLAATIVTTANDRGTRLKAYVANQNFPLYPQVQFWVSPNGTPAGNTSMLWLGHGDAAVTIENIVAPQYGTGVTTFVSFETDGQFAANPPLVPTIPGDKYTSRHPGSPPPPPLPARRIETIGDSITAATNVVRPEGAGSCGDGGYQSDWSQTYSALLCHRFGAECSTVAVGGKCVMRECGGLQMPDYFTGAFYKDGATPTFDFKWQPDVMVIDLGTNDMRAITKIGVNTTTGEGPGMDRFTEETVQFMKNATILYKKPDIQFFLTSGPMENTTYTGTVAAINQAKSAGLKATLIDMRAACASARLHAPDDSDQCDGCAGHPGIQGHYEMYEAAWPVIKSTMGW